MSVSHHHDHRAHSVLVVEDEALVRSCVAFQFESEGFAVIEAADAEEALRAFEDHPEVEAVFTDCNMPGRFDGLSLLQQIFERRPDVRLILTSGRGEPDPGDMPDGAIFLAKPYDIRSLAALVLAH